MPTGYVIIVAITIQLLTHGAAAAVLNEVRRIRGILTSGKSRTQGMPECIRYRNGCRRTKRRAGQSEKRTFIWSMEDSADRHACDSGYNRTYGDHSHAKERTVTVRDMTWKTSVDVEKYILCDEDDWELPEGMPR